MHDPRDLDHRHNNDQRHDLDHRHDNDHRHACLSHRSLSIGAHTTCHRTSSKKDVGAGPDWICHVKWKDNTGTAQNGKFELAAKANYCYVAGGPSKIVGTLTISDKHGRQVLNPLFEFDAATTQAPSRPYRSKPTSVQGTVGRVHSVAGSAGVRRDVLPLPLGRPPGLNCQRDRRVRWHQHAVLRPLAGAWPRSSGAGSAPPPNLKVVTACTD